MVGDGVNDVPGAEGGAPRDRAGHRARRWRKSVADVVLVDGDFAAVPAHGRRGPPDPPQPPARDEAVRDEVGVRRVPDPLDRDDPDRVPAAAAPSDARGDADDRRSPRSSSRSRRATGRGEPTASCATWAASRCRPGSPPGSAVTTTYLFALNVLRPRPLQSRTAATSTLVVVGLYLVLALEASSRGGRGSSGSSAAPPGGVRCRPRSPGLRRFLSSPCPTGPFVLIVVGAGTAIGLLWLTDDRFIPLRGGVG